MKRMTAQWVKKAEDDLKGARALAARKPPLKDIVCFHCQQSAEKYLKAFLQEVGSPIPKIHDLEDLLLLLLPHDATVKRLTRTTKSLTRYAVEYRYPGVNANTRQMQAALRNAERVRREMRTRIGLSP